MISILLKLVLLFNPLYRRAGADIRQLEIILTTKLTVDNRSALTFNSFGRSRAAGSNTLLVRGIILFVFGLAFMMVLINYDQSLLGHTIYFTAFIVLLVSVLISDFTGILIDVKDNYIILTRPVSDTTLTVSKLLHIGLHLTHLMIPPALPGWLAVFFKDGLIPGLLFPVQVLLALFISICFVNALYLLMLKALSPSRFKDVITWFQVSLLMLIFTGYLFFPTFMDQPLTEGTPLLEMPVSYFLPPVWLAALHEWGLGRINGPLLSLSLTGIVVPLACLFLVVKFLAPGFNRKLTLIGSPGPGKTLASRQGPRKSLSSRLSRILTRTPAEDAGFRITWQLSSRLREFKINSYPTYAFIPAYFFYFTLKDSGTALAEKWQSLASGESHLFILYLLSFLPITFLHQVTKSEKYKAAWVYYLPEFQPGHVLSGMFMAVWVKLVLPAFIAVVVFTIAIWGWSVSTDILLALVNNLLISILLAYRLVKRFPFSEPNLVEKQFGKVFYYFQFMLMPVAIGLLHSFINQWPGAVLAFTLLSAGVAWGVFKQYRQLDRKHMR